MKTGDVGFVSAGRGVKKLNYLATMVAHVENKIDKPKLMARDLFMRLNVRGKSGTGAAKGCCQVLLV